MDTARIFIPITNYKHYIFSYFLFKEMLKKSTDKKSDRVLAVQAFHVISREEENQLYNKY